MGILNVGPPRMDVRQILLNLLAARTGLPADRSREELIAQLAAERPELGLLLQAMSSSSEEIIADDEDELPLDELLDAAPARDDLRDATAVIAALRAVLEGLARALGACPMCWGRDAFCERCQGLGSPGSTRPDPELFRELVLPALRRWKSETQPRVRPQRHRHPPNGGNGHHPDTRSES